MFVDSFFERMLLRFEIFSENHDFGFLVFTLNSISHELQQGLFLAVVTIICFFTLSNFSLLSPLNFFDKASPLFVISQKPIVAGQALIDISEIISFEFEEQCLKNTLDWLLGYILQWYFFPSVLNIVNELEQVSALLNDVELYLLDVLCEQICLCFVFKRWVS